MVNGFVWCFVAVGLRLAVSDDVNSVIHQVFHPAPVDSVISLFNLVVLPQRDEMTSAASCSWFIACVVGTDAYARFSLTRNQEPVSTICLTFRPIVVMYLRSREWFGSFF